MSLQVRIYKVLGDELAVAAAGAEAVAGLSSLEALFGPQQVDLTSDIGLLSRRSRDVLPRTAIGRRAAEAMRQVGQALHITDDAEMPPPVVAFAGALADELIAALSDRNLSAARVAIKGAISAFGPGLAADDRADPLLLELDEVSEAKGVRGLAWAGLNGAHPVLGLADRVALRSGSAAVAAYSAAMITDRVDVAQAPAVRQAGAAGEATGLFAHAFRDSKVTRSVGQMPPDQIWEALSAGMRAALALRSARMLQSGVITVKGRGRVIGPIDQNRLLRFGVSDWR